MAQDRRAFLKHSAAALSAVSLSAEDVRGASPSTEPPRALDATLLRAAGDAILPKQSGPRGVKPQSEPSNSGSRTFSPSPN